MHPITPVDTFRLVNDMDIVPHVPTWYATTTKELGSVIFVFSLVCVYSCVGIRVAVAVLRLSIGTSSLLCIHFQKKASFKKAPTVPFPKYRYATGTNHNQSKVKYKLWVPSYPHGGLA